ncbi:hypothetical protein E2C01_007469 [Portunus trituberculatus]|uniref:Uncharacterized protein n=1 Tax=Portunus trituberculatus TaxID=210409 RepID=A0A5B7CZJ1_PORTR|nr:hypothetical protein [Portunus trituberculatus]
MMAAQALVGQCAGDNGGGDEECRGGGGRVLTTVGTGGPHAGRHPPITPSPPTPPHPRTGPCCFINTHPPPAESKGALVIGYTDRRVCSRNEGNPAAFQPDKQTLPGTSLWWRETAEAFYAKEAVGTLLGLLTIEPGILVGHCS